MSRWCATRATASSWTAPTTWVPVDARLERDVETVALDDLLVATVGARLRLVILDACRNNPLARSMQRTVASRSVSGGSFAQLDEDLLGDETLVAYAAAAGTRRRTGREGTARTRRRCWRTWTRRWRSCRCSGGFGRGCWRRRTGSSGRTSTSLCSGSTT